MAQLNDLIVNGYTRFLNSAYGNLNGSATSALCAAYAAAAPVAPHSITSTSHSDTGTFFSGNSARSACSATSAKSAGTATNVQMQAKSDNTWYQSLFASTSTSSIWYDSDAKVQYNPSSNTFSSTNLYGTTVSGATVSATTSKATNFSGSTISGTSTSMAINDLINSAKRTIGDGTITITTASAPSTSQTFKVNQTSNSSIVFGTMAFKASGDYSPTSHNHNYKLSGNGTAVNVSAGVNFKPSGSNIQFFVSGNDIYISGKDTTGTDTKVTQSSSTENSALPFILKRTTTGNETNTVKYTTATTFNPSSREFKIVASNGEDSVSITPTHLSCTYGELHNPCSVNLSDLIGVTSYFSGGSAKSACSATSAKNAGTAAYALTVPDSAVTGKTIGTANNAKQVSSTHTANNANFYLEFIDSTANGYKKLYHNTGLQYNPSAHILYISGSSATIVNGDDNTVTVDKQRFNFINGITNTVSTATNTRITSGVGIFGSNNTAMGLKNGAIIGTNIKVTGNNTAGYNISNILFLGDNNAVDNLNQYENAKLIISQGKTWEGSLHGTDVFAIKGGGSVWTNVLKRNTEDVFDCNGHNDIIYNYAPMYKMPVASPTQDQTYHYNSTYGINDNYLVVSRDGFLVPTDITISKTTDTLLGADAAARMVLINLVAGKDTQGTITIGQDAPGYLNVGTSNTAVVRLGDNHADVKIGYANADSYGTVDIGNIGNGNSNLKVYGNETVSAITALTAYIPNLSSVNFSTTNISGTTISATTVKGVTVSGTSAYALTASAKSGMFTSATASYLTANTATGNSAKFTTFSGTTFNGGTFSGNLSGSAASALTSKSALTAGAADNVKWSIGTVDAYRPIGFANTDASASYNAGNPFYQCIVYDSAGLSYNPANNRLSAEKVYTKYLQLSENCTEYVTAGDVTQIQNPRICFSACENNDHQIGYLIWSDYNNTNLWNNSTDPDYFGDQISDGFVLTSNQGNTIQAVKNFSATNIKSKNTMMCLGKNTYVHSEPIANTASKTYNRSLSSTLPAGTWRNNFNSFYVDGGINQSFSSSEFSTSAGGAVAIGQNASAVGRNSFAFGNSAFAIAPYSYVFAKGGVSYNYGQALFGTFPVINRTLLSVGIGSADNSRKDAFTLTRAAARFDEDITIYCNNISTTSADISNLNTYSLTAQNATARNLEIRPDFWTGAYALKTYANDFTEWFSQTSKYPMGGQSSGGPDGLIRAGRIKQAFFVATARQSADISFLYSLVKWQGTTWNFKAMCPFGSDYGKCLIFDFNDLNKQVTVFHNDGSTAISTAQQYKLYFNTNGMPGLNLYYIGNRCIDITVTIGDSTGRYYMFINSYD